MFEERKFFIDFKDDDCFNFKILIFLEYRNCFIEVRFRIKDKI